MKTYRLPRLLAVALGLAALTSAGCAEKEKSPVGTAPVPTPAPVPTEALPAATPVAPSVGNWTDIRNDTFDMRDQFFAGLKQLDARVDGQISELTAKRATMGDTAYTKDWDFAMKEMTDARSYLLSMGEEARKATRETWDQQREKVGIAWTRTQDAYTKVKASTTN